MWVCADVGVSTGVGVSSVISNVCSIPIERYSQSTSMAHTSTITSLHCIEKLGLFVSGSEDCTVRVWDRNNQPIKSVIVWWDVGHL